MADQPDGGAPLNQEPPWPSAETAKELGLTSTPDSQGHPEPPQSPPAAPPGDSHPPPVEPPPQQPVSTAVKQWMSQQGYDVSSYQDDSQLLADLEAGMNRAQQAPSAEELERFKQLQPVLHQYATSAPQFEEWRKQQEAAKQTPEEPEKPKWQPPQMSETTQRLINAGVLQVDQSTGMYKGDPQFASYAQEANSALEWRQNVSDRLLRDPLGVLEEAGLFDKIDLDGRLKTFEEQVIQKVMGQISGKETQQTIEQYLEQNTSKFFQVDQSGQYLRSPQTGQPVLTEYGQAYQRAATQAKDQFGITDPTKVHEFALTQLPKEPEVSTPTPQQQRQAKQETFLDRARGNRNGNGQYPPPNRDATVATAAARESAQNEMSDDAVWDSAYQQALSERV